MVRLTGALANGLEETFRLFRRHLWRFGLSLLGAGSVRCGIALRRLPSTLVLRLLRSVLLLLLLLFGLLLRVLRCLLLLLRLLLRLLLLLLLLLRLLLILLRLLRLLLLQLTQQSLRQLEVIAGLLLLRLPLETIAVVSHGRLQMCRRFLRIG